MGISGAWYPGAQPVVGAGPVVVEHLLQTGHALSEALECRQARQRGGDVRSRQAAQAREAAEMACSLASRRHGHSSVSVSFRSGWPSAVVGGRKLPDYFLRLATSTVSGFRHVSLSLLHPVTSPAFTRSTRCVLSQSLLLGPHVGCLDDHRSLAQARRHHVPPAGGCCGAWFATAPARPPLLPGPGSLLGATPGDRCPAPLWSCARLPGGQWYEMPWARPR